MSQGPPLVLVSLVSVPQTCVWTLLNVTWCPRVLWHIAVSATQNPIQVHVQTLHIWFLRFLTIRSELQLMLYISSYNSFIYSHFCRKCNDKKWLILWQSQSRPYSIRTQNDWCTGKDLKRSSRGPIKVLSWHLYRSKPWKTSIRIASVTAKIQTKHSPKTSLKWYCYMNLFGSQETWMNGFCEEVRTWLVKEHIFVWPIYV